MIESFFFFNFRFNFCFLLLLLLLFILFGVPSKRELNTKLVYKFPSSSIFNLGQMGPE